MTQYKLYIGTYSKGEDKGVFYGEFDGNTGEVQLNGTIGIENPSYLQLSKNRLYGVSEVASFEGEDGGALFSVDVVDHRLVRIYGTHGKHPCHLYVKDGAAFVSNYTEGSLSFFQTDKDGDVIPTYQSIHHFGKSVNPDRQEASHIHFATMDIKGEFLAVCDLGMDRVFLYPCLADGGIGTNAEVIECPPGSGPRHLTFSHDGQYLYVLTEMGNTVLVYQYQKGEVCFLQEISTLPADFAGNSFAAAIHLSPDGTRLVTSNRGHDSLVIFGINADGTLIALDYVETGSWPRDFSYSPCGNWVLVANQEDNSVMMYRIENDSFRQIGSVEVPKPVCIAFERGVINDEKIRNFDLSRTLND